MASQDQCAYYQEAAERRERKQYPEAADVGFAGRLELRVAQSGERQCADRREDEQTGIQPDDRSETARAVYRLAAGADPRSSSWGVKRGAGRREPGSRSGVAASPSRRCMTGGQEHAFSMQLAIRDDDLATGCHAHGRH